jgi:hypothetical protein
MIRLKVMENTLIWMEPNTKDFGEKISSMVKGKSLGLMELCMKVIMFMERSMDSESSNGPMVQSMKASLKIITSKVKVNTAGLMADLLLDLGNKIRCMVEVSSLGPMVENTKESM